MKWKSLSGFMFGIILMIASSVLFAEENTFSASVVGVFAIYVFLLVGISIGEGAINQNGPVKFEDLKSGFYEVSAGFFEPLHCAQTGCCADKFMVLERREKQFLVDVGIAQRLGIEKVLGEIRRGAELEIDKKGQIKGV